MSRDLAQNTIPMLPSAPAATFPQDSAPQAPPAAAAPGATPIAVDAQWACKTFALDERGQAAGELRNPLTVGDKFLLVCEGQAGQSPVALSADKLSLLLPKEARYMLRLFETRELKDSRGEFVATAWQAGEIKLTNPVLSDGSKRIGLGPIEINVSTVIDPGKNPEGKPYPPWGPLTMPWPSYVWYSLALAILFIGLAIWSQVNRLIRRKRLLRLLESAPIAMKPYFQFNKDLRRLGRELPSTDAGWEPESAKSYLRELDQALRWYLARELILPVFDRRPAEIARDLYRLDKTLHGVVRRDLLIALREIERASGQKRVSVTDAQQIMDLSRAVADRIHDAKEAAP